ncbi:MAG TPA: hypothetical protein VK588_04920 [Chitinophagaceae bacterium]|nr:hypothetical protein [Chitinophagaceae bacterium]
MIKRALLYSLLFVAVYSTAITLLGPKDQVVQHQWQSNLIKAQNFIYNKEADTIENVIIGTSLSCRLVMDSLKNYYNLAFSGQSIFDGLNILSHRKKLPRNVFIETNIVFKKEDKDFTSSLTNPILYNTRLYMPSLREGKQPLGIIGEKFAYVVGGIISRLKPNAPAKDGADGEMSSRQNQLFSKILKQEIENYSRQPEQKLVNESFACLEAYLEPLRKEGVHIIFFEMPVNYNLCSLRESVAVRENFYKNFPEKEYGYISQPDCTNYKTTDGLHLNNQEAITYTTYFREAAKHF